MSTLLFPSGLKGLDIEVDRTSQFSTLIQTGASGKEQRATFWTSPRWTYEWTLNFVRQAGFSAKTLSDELLQLASFFNTMRGAWDSFYFIDPVNGTPSACPFGIGNNSQTIFQLADNEGFSASNVQGIPTLFRSDWQGLQLLYSSARTNLLSYSQDLTNAAWTKGTGVTVTGNVVAAPDGTMTADRIAYAGSGSAGETLATQSFGAGGPAIYSHQVWMRADSPCTVLLGYSGAVCTLTTTWRAYTFSAYSPATLQLAIALPAGVNTLPNIYAWGAQCEQASVVASYIPTASGGASLTDYTLNATTGAVTMGQAPANGAAISWTGQFARVCRFVDDSMTFKRFMQLAWDGGTVKVITLK
jgi:hypothetical protein